MKVKLLFVGLLCSQLLSAQKSFICYDDVFREPISNVQIFDSKGQFLGLSNENGKFETGSDKLPFELKKSGFEIVKLTMFSDTVKLTPKFQQIDEVTIKPIVKMDLYNAIIENSSANVSHESSKQYGIYFQSLLMIDTKNNDTVRTDMYCDLGIDKIGSKKKIDYTLFTENGKKKYVFSGTGKGELASASSDTSSFGKMLNVLPSFDKNLEYDLTKTKKYSLDYDENQIKRELGDERSRLIFGDNKNLQSKVVTEYKDSILLSWMQNLSQSKEYDGKGIFVNFKKMNRQIVFSENEKYEFTSIIENAIIEIGLSGVLYQIYVVKGFIEDPSRAFEMKEETKKIEDYFKTIPNSDDMDSFYNFELEK